MGCVGSFTWGNVDRVDRADRVESFEPPQEGVFYEVLAFLAVSR